MLQNTVFLSLMQQLVNINFQSFSHGQNNKAGRNDGKKRGLLGAARAIITIMDTVAVGAILRGLRSPSFELTLFCCNRKSEIQRI